MASQGDLPPILVPVAMMLLYPSSCPADLVRRALDNREDLTSNIAFQEAYYLGLAQSLRGAATHVFLGPRVVAKPDDYYSVEGSIGLAITTAVESMPVGLA